MTPSFVATIEERMAGYQSRYGGMEVPPNGVSEEWMLGWKWADDELRGKPSGKRTITYGHLRSA